MNEQEVSITKEKLVCLVCKTEAKGYSSVFICKNCKVLYCERCAQEIARLENACWNCRAQFDMANPARPYEMDDDNRSINVIENLDENNKNILD